MEFDEELLAYEAHFDEASQDRDDSVPWWTGLSRSCRVLYNELHKDWETKAILSAAKICRLNM